MSTKMTELIEMTNEFLRGNRLAPGFLVPKAKNVFPPFVKPTTTTTEALWAAVLVMTIRCWILENSHSR